MINKTPALSFEFFPPRTDKGAEILAKVHTELARFEPTFFSVTYGAGGSTQQGTFDAVQSMRLAGTDAAPHITCVGSSRDEIKSIIDSYLAIGVSRLVGGIIEASHDENGIIWPDAIAPFHIAIIPINMHKSDAVADKCEALYQELTAAGYDVLLMDEEKARLGGMLANVELIGIPHRVVIGDRGLESGKIEYKGRLDTDKQEVASDEILELLKSKIKLSC